MVFYIVNRAAEIVSGKRLGEKRGSLLPLMSVPESADYKVDFGGMGCKICDLPHAMGPAVLVDPHMLYIGESQPGFAQAVGDGSGGKPRPMLDPAKALLFRRPYQDPVLY